jgi:hypothetical protein
MSEHIAIARGRRGKGLRSKAAKQRKTDRATAHAGRHETTRHPSDWNPR